MDIFTLTTSTILSMYMNISGANGNQQLAYNADIENNQVNAIYVYDDNCGQLTRKSKQHFGYDEQGRLLRKDTYTWDARRREWQPATRLDYVYDEGCLVLEYAQWSTEAQAFAAPTQRTVYTQLMNNVASIEEYRWDERQHALLLADNYLLLCDDYGYLLAQQ